MYKDEIKRIVNEMDNENDLRLFHTFLHKTMLKKYVQEFLDIKCLGSDSNVEWLTDLILFKSDQSIEEKLEFGKLLLDFSKHIPTNVFIEVGHKNLIGNTLLSESKVFQDIKYHVMTRTKFDGLNNIQTGKGEIFLILFGRGAVQGYKSDLRLVDREIEIKAQNSRCRGMNGYNTPRNVNIIKILKKELDFDMDSLRMSYKKYENMNKEFDRCGKSPKVIVDTFKKIFSKIYTVPEGFEVAIKQNKWIDKMFNKGRFTKNSIHYLTAMQIDYYKYIEKFDYIMFLLPEKFQSIVLENGNDYMLYHDSFHLQPFGWNGMDSRDSVNMMSYTGKNNE